MEERARLRGQLGLPDDRFVGDLRGPPAPSQGRRHAARGGGAHPGADARDRRRRPGARDVSRRSPRGWASATACGFRGLSANVADVLRASDAFFLSSHGEGMSNALLEAMACGLPCLASRSVGGAGELLGDGRGLLLADGDAAAWTAAIRRLIDEPSLRAETGAPRRRSSPKGCRWTRPRTGWRGPTRSWPASPPGRRERPAARPVRGLALPSGHRDLRASTSGWCSRGASGWRSRRCGTAASRPCTPSPGVCCPGCASSTRKSPGGSRPTRSLPLGGRARYLSALLAVFRAALALPPRQAAKELIVFLEAAALALTAERAARRPRPRALRQPSGHRGVGRAPADRHPVQLHRPRQRPVRRARRCSTARSPTRGSSSRSPSTTGGRCSRRCPSAARVEVVHCGVDVERHRPTRSGRPSAGPAPCAWPASRPRRATLHLIDALALLAERRPRVVARARRRRAPSASGSCARARERGVAHRVRLLGALPAEEVRAALARARVFVAGVRAPAQRPDGGHPSGADGGDGRRRARGRHPAVGHPELVHDGVTGLLVRTARRPGARSGAGRTPRGRGARCAAGRDGRRELVERSFNLAHRGGAAGRPLRRLDRSRRRYRASGRGR